MSIRGLRGRISTDNNEVKDVTVSEDSGKVALDVNIVSGGGGGGGGPADSTAANQTLQITEAQSTNTKLDSLIAGQSTSDTTEAKQDALIAKLEEVRVLLDNLRDEPKHDTKTITYVASGNGVGEVETIVYSLAASTVLTRTFFYNGDNKVTSVVDS